MEKTTILPPSQRLEAAAVNLPQLPRLRTIKNVVSRLRILLPSWLLTDTGNDSSGRLLTSDTAWLDGIRGLASIAVLNFHYLFAFGDWPLVGFGADAQSRHPIRLPFLRLCYDGNDAVCIFFVVSGYVCSLQALKRMHNREHTKSLSSLSRSAFRRGFRLFLPTLSMTMITALCAHMGMFLHFQNMMTKKSQYFPGAFSEPGLERLPTLKDQIQFWTREMLSLMNIWVVTPQYLHHDPHLWTIAYEYRSSMFLYMTLLGLVFCKPRVRMLVLVVAGLVNLWWARWEGPLFFGGAAIAQLTIMREVRPDSLLSPSPCRQLNTSYSTPRKLLRYSGYAFALWICSYPKNNFKKPAPGFSWIDRVRPPLYNSPERFSKTVGILLLFLLLATSKSKTGTNASIFHRAFTSSFAQYMGRVMFAFYLVHGTILHIIGYALPHVVWNLTGKENAFTYAFGLVGGLALNFLLCIWAADVFTREIDARCARLVRWLEEVCFEKL